MPGTPSQALSRRRSWLRGAGSTERPRPGLAVGYPAAAETARSGADESRR